MSQFFWKHSGFDTMIYNNINHWDWVRHTGSQSGRETFFSSANSDILSKSIHKLAKQHFIIVY